MNFQTIKPSYILQKYIKQYWMLETNGSEGTITERVIPTGSVDLVFHYGKSLKVQKPDGSTYEQTPALISGISSSYVDVMSDQEIGMIAVVFKPHSASLFFSFPLNIVENQSVGLRDLLKGEFKIVEEKLDAATTLFERIQCIESFLLGLLNKNGNKQIDLVSGAIQIINKSRGQISSNQLADELGVSKRQLERKFAAYLGKSPKKFIKIVRFQNVLATSDNISEEKLSNLAYDNGYFDQAHFINDFKTHTGYTPKEFFRLYSGGSDYFE